MCSQCRASPVMGGQDPRMCHHLSDRHVVSCRGWGRTGRLRDSPCTSRCPGGPACAVPRPRAVAGRVQKPPRGVPGPPGHVLTLPPHRSSVLVCLPRVLPRQRSPGVPPPSRAGQAAPGRGRAARHRDRLQGLREGRTLGPRVCDDPVPVLGGPTHEALGVRACQPPARRSDRLRGRVL